eukprot:802256-Pyramimonas_sp.AAC.1
MHLSLSGGGGSSHFPQAGRSLAVEDGGFGLPRIWAADVSRGNHSERLAFVNARALALALPPILHMVAGVE